MQRELTEEDIHRARIRAEKLGDPWLAAVIRRMAQEMKDLREQHAAALFVQGIGG